MSDPHDPAGSDTGPTWAERVRAAASAPIDPDLTRSMPFAPPVDEATDHDATGAVLLDDVADPEATDATDGGEAPPTRGRHRPRHLRRDRTVRVVVEWAVVIVGALVVALVIKTFLFQAFYIPSPSMEPTLREGDRVLVNKLSYRLHDVNRGDVVVFERPPNQPSSEIKDLIKRVVALPGEVIESRNGSVYIDGRRLDEPYLLAEDSTDDITQHDLCEAPPSGVVGCKVPAGSVFVMGDNRRNSEDSRRFGPIDEDLIVGRAFIQIWPVSELSRL